MDDYGSEFMIAYAGVMLIFVHFSGLDSMITIPATIFYCLYILDEATK